MKNKYEIWSGTRQDLIQEILMLEQQNPQAYKMYSKNTGKFISSPNIWVLARLSSCDIEVFFVIYLVINELSLCPLVLIALYLSYQPMVLNVLNKVSNAPCLLY